MRIATTSLRTGLAMTKPGPSRRRGRRSRRPARTRRSGEHCSPSPPALAVGAANGRPPPWLLCTTGPAQGTVLGVAREVLISLCFPAKSANYPAKNTTREGFGSPGQRKTVCPQAFQAER